MELNEGKGERSVTEIVGEKRRVHVRRKEKEWDGGEGYYSFILFCVAVYCIKLNHYITTTCDLCFPPFHCSRRRNGSRTLFVPSLNFLFSPPFSSFSSLSPFSWRNESGSSRDPEPTFLHFDALFAAINSFHQLPLFSREQLTLNTNWFSHLSQPENQFEIFRFLYPFQEPSFIFANLSEKEIPSVLFSRSSSLFLRDKCRRK